MKGLSITGFIISILLLLGALYLQFVIAPGVASLEAAINYDDDGFSSMVWSQALTLQRTLGIVMLLGGVLSLILCIIPALKTKSKLAWIGVVISLVVVFVGLMNGTHMFS